MTQIPSKSNSNNDSNGRGSYFENFSFQEQTPTTNYSPASEEPLSPENPTIKESKPALVEPDFRHQKPPRSGHSTHWWSFASLRTKAMILALTIGTVPVLLIGSTAYLASNQKIEEQVLQNEQTNALDLEDKLNNFVRERYDDAQLIAQNKVFSNAKIRETSSREEKEQILNGYIKTSGIYDNIAVYDLKGNPIALSQGDAVANYFDLDYTQAVLKTDRPFIAEPRLAKATGIFSFFVASPIKDDETGKTIAIVRTRVPMTLLQEVFGFTTTRQQEFYVKDSKGQIVATSQKESLQKKIEEEFPKLFSKIKQAGDQRVSTIAPAKQIPSVVTYIPNQKLAKTYNLNWGLLLSRPTEIAFATQRQLLLTILIGTGAVTVIVGALAAFIANRATRPILDAAKAVDKIGQGELDTRLEVQGADELSVLGANINEMAAQLQIFTQEQVSVADEQRRLKEELQQRALELLMEVDPISKGDLTIQAKVTSDEIGTIADSYNFTVANLRKIVTKVQEAASLVAQTTSSSEASVQSLSVEALHQAEEIAQVLAKAQEMTESVRLVAANAEQAEVAVKQAAQTVQDGDAAMNRTVDGIVAIRETVAETAKKVKHLGESSQKISTVVSLISSFAAQTNLLALNASIEAARAGEDGRGFAVVAEEVRSLARQSAEATKEIEQLIFAIQAETNEVVTAMETGTQQVVVGTKLVDETRQSLNKITAASTQINTLVEAIALATVVQSQASESVTQTMTNVAVLAKKTSQEASSVSSSFEQLLTVAHTLQEDVGKFKVR